MVLKPRNEKSKLSKRKNEIANKMREKTTKNKKGHHKQAINNGKVIRSEEMK